MSSGPNIYLVLLDGYPRRDTLREDFDIDNGPFVEALERLGFVVAEDSRANYPTTLLTLTSMLHMTYVQEIAELSGDPDQPSKQVRMLSTAINRSPALALLKDAGYRTVTVPSWYGEATLSAADDVRGSGHLTIFEEQVLRLSSAGQLVLGHWPNLVADQQRARTEVALAELGHVAAEAKEPTFVLAHIFSPHAPLLFEADGSPLPAPACYPAECSFNITEAAALGMTVEKYGAALDGHLRHLNRLVIQAVTKVIEADSAAVIVLFSDHGTRYDDRDVDEHFRTFMAARTPNPADFVRQVATPVNVLPALFNGYLGADIPLREPRMWAADAGAPLEMTPLPLLEGNR